MVQESNLDLESPREIVKNVIRAIKGLINRIRVRPDGKPSLHKLLCPKHKDHWLLVPYFVTANELSGWCLE